MASVTAIYCLKRKKERNDVDLYRNIVKLLNRQNAQGDLLTVQGLFEAKKSFWCFNFDSYHDDFKIEKGEYFLLVDGKDYHTNQWHLFRACRNSREQKAARVLTGVPECENVYDDSTPLQERVDPELDENRFFRQLPVEFPSCEEEELPPELRGDSFLTVYTIREKTRSDREDLWGITPYAEKDFSGKPELSALFQQLIQCDSAQRLREIPERQKLVDEILRRESVHYEGGEIYPHFSTVIGVIDGGNRWRCGIWCYKREKGKAPEIHEVDGFCPSGYKYVPQTGLIPQFDF